MDYELIYYTNNDNDDGDNDDNRNRLQEFDRLDLDADMFAMEDDANHNDAETGDLFLDGDDDDAASEDDASSSPDDDFVFFFFFLPPLEDGFLAVSANKIM